MHCESESLVKSGQFVIIIQTQMYANSRRLPCMPQPGPSCRDAGLRICIQSLWLVLFASLSSL